MTRIGDKFIELKRLGEKALIPFFFAGDPDMETTFELILSAESAGADIIELGIPYSDPLADGPVNQQAASRALKNGFKIKDIFSFVKRVRKVTDIPIVFLLYFNCIMQYGIENFLKDCTLSGVDGLVIPDLPYEEKLNYKNAFKKYPVDIIALVTPSSKERLKQLVKDSSGFIYCVTSSGVTGTRSSFKTDFASFTSEIACFTDTPRVLGFGISTPRQVEELKKYAEGIIVGSAIVRLIGDGSKGDMVKRVSKFVKELKDALK
ncbi:MAG: tryptophan synthase subunit alpha [Eubacteriales bacterium]